MVNKVNISDNKELLDIHNIYPTLTEESTWVKGIDLHTVKVSVDNSVCAGTYSDSDKLVVVE